MEAVETAPVTGALDKLQETRLGDTEINELTGEIGPKMAVSYTPEEEAAARFLYLLPYVKRIGKNLGGNAVVRVLYALAEFPLGDDKPKLKSKEEKQLFDIFQELMASKSLIIKHALEKQKEAEQAEKTEGVATDGGN